jgi:hypothetical protein
MPWSKLTYDTNVGGYRTDVTEDQLRGAPAFSRDRSWDWSDRSMRRSADLLLRVYRNNDFLAAWL